mmetsp:Transcript_66747/g.156458  ORF Transcript_66747/g.156458 Transcript_66747/m.156458 type:complete len:267 (-) Transcript_66747:32-832(-)
MEEEEEPEISHPSQLWDGKPPKQLTLRLIMELSLTPGELGAYDKMSEEEALERVRVLKSLHLQWQGFAEICGLEPFESAEVLYLQANRIERIENLECMPRLQFLALQCNRIAVVENLLCLPDLEFLDLSRNEIAKLDVKQLPKKINMLNFRGNTCVEAPDYLPSLLAHLPDLSRLDGEDLDGAANPEPEKKIEIEPLPSSSSALASYWMRKNLHDGVAADIKDCIDAYSVEALENSQDFSHKVQEATARSRARQQEAKGYKSIQSS